MTKLSHVNWDTMFCIDGPQTCDILGRITNTDGSKFNDLKDNYKIYIFKEGSNVVDIEVAQRYDGIQGFGNYMGYMKYSISDTILVCDKWGRTATCDICYDP